MTQVTRLCTITRACEVLVYKRPESGGENYLEKALTDTEILWKRRQEMNNVSKKYAKQ